MKKSKRIHRPITDRKDSLSHLTVIMHLVLGLLFIWMLFGGWVMTTFNLKSHYIYHKNLGTILLVFFVLRIIWRMINGWPQPNNPQAKLINFCNKVLMWILLLGTLAFPISGIIMSIASGNGLSILFWQIVEPTIIDGVAIPINNQLNYYAKLLHSYLFYIMSVILVLHIIVAYIYQKIYQDFTVKRIFGFWHNNPNKQIISNKVDKKR